MNKIKFGQNIPIELKLIDAKIADYELELSLDDGKSWKSLDDYATELSTKKPEEFKTRIVVKCNN